MIFPNYRLPVLRGLDAMSIAVQTVFGKIPFEEWKNSSVWKILPIGVFFGLPMDAWKFAVRTSLSAVLALFTAFFFRLESPFWAATTAFIVANPLRGRILAKGAARYLGTMVGGVVAIVFTALFAQTPELFVLCMALWIGLCTAVSNLFRNFHSYGMMLAGYTAGIVGFFVAIHNPLHVFNSVWDRMAAITIGITASAIVSAIFASGGARKDFQNRVRMCVSGFSELSRHFLLKRNFPDFAKTHQKLSVQVLSLEEIIEYAVSESGKTSSKEISARLCVTHLMRLMTSAGALAHNLEKSPDSLPAVQEKASLILEIATQRMISVMREDPEKVSDWRVITPFIEELAQLKEMYSQSSDDIQTMTCLSRIHEMIGHMEKVVVSWKQFSFSEASDEKVIPPMSFHRDYVSACINGLRTWIVVLVAAAFWITTAFQYGEQMVFVVSTQCCLVCSRPNPAMASLGFLYGSFWLLPVCFVFQFFIMPHIVSPEVMALLLAMFFMPGCLAMAHPSPIVAGTGMSYLIFFMNQSMLLNHSQYNVVSYLNSGLILVVANILTIVVFWLIFPVSPLREIRKLVGSLRKEVQLLARKDINLPVRSTWETRTYDRLLRLIQHSNPSSHDSEKILHGAIAILQMGTDVMQLRELEERPELSPQMRLFINRALDAFSSIHENHEIKLNEIGDALLQINEYSATTPSARQDRWLAVSCLHEMVHLLSDYRPLFSDSLFEEVCS